MRTSRPRSRRPSPWPRRSPQPRSLPPRSLPLRPKRRPPPRRRLRSPSRSGAEEPAAESEEAPAEPQAPPAPAAAEPKPKRKRVPRGERRQRSKPTREKPAERKPIVRQPKPEHARGGGRSAAVVISAAMDKTIVVRVDSVKPHPVYKKIVRRSSRLHVHDEANTAKLGDLVRVVETRPGFRRRSTGASPRLRKQVDDPAGIPPSCRRQHGSPRAPLHPRARRLPPPLRARGRRDRGHGQDGHPAGHDQEGRGREGGRGQDEEAVRPERRHLDRLRRERRRDHRRQDNPRGTRIFGLSPASCARRTS